MRKRPRPSVSGLLRIVAALLVAIVVFGAGVLVGGHPVATGLTRLPDAARDLVLGEGGDRLPDQVLDVVDGRYYRDVDLAGLERASVEAIIATLGDPYTEYLTPEELRALRAHYDGAYYGVGVQVALRGRQIVVTRVFPDGPAADADVRAGDRLVSVDGRRVAGRGLQWVAEHIRGPDGTSVTIVLRRPADGTVRRVELRRARFEEASVRSRVERTEGADVGYLRLARFTRGSGDALREAVERLEERGVAALVLDLRGDPGGLVVEAVDVAGVFLPRGAPVVTTEGRRSPERTLRTKERPASRDLPLVVLVNAQSASASEIVAGALRDAGRATLVGTRTFGKAVVQTTVALRDGGALKLTTERYRTPDGHQISPSGLKPQVRADDDPATLDDEALARALRVAARGA